MTPIIVILWKENKNLQKRKMSKNHKILFLNWLFREEKPFEENKTVKKNKFNFNR